MLIDWLSVSRTLQAVLPDNVDAFKDFGDDNVFLCVEHLLKVADTPPSPVRASIGSENKELDRAPGEVVFSAVAVLLFVDSRSRDSMAGSVISGF